MPQIAVAGPAAARHWPRWLRGSTSRTRHLASCGWALVDRFASFGSASPLNLPVKSRCPWSGKLWWLPVKSSHCPLRAGRDGANVDRERLCHWGGAERAKRQPPTLGRMMKETGDFIGRVMSARPALADTGRPRLVGIRSVESGKHLRSGAHLVSKPYSSRSLGWVTSVTRSIELGHWIRLAMLEHGDAMNGKTVFAVAPLHDEAIEVMFPVDVISTRRTSVFAPDHPSRSSGATRLQYAGLAGRDAISIVEQRRSLVHLTARRGQQPALSTAIWQNLQLGLSQPGHPTIDGINTLIWVQPGSWLLQAPIDAGESLSVHLKSALASVAAEVDQSDGKSSCSYPASAREILARCCRLDLHPRVFGAGRAMPRPDCRLELRHMAVGWTAGSLACLRFALPHR